MLRTVQSLDAPGSAASRAHRPAPPTEEELAVLYAVHGDERAFRALHARTAPFLLRLAYRRVRSRDTASDLVQQAFLNAHVARERFEAGQRFRPWITRILLNLVLDHQRTSKRRPIAEIEPEELAAPDSKPAAERREVALRARHALAELSARKREVIELHFLEEKPFPEVARRLGEHVSTVKVRAHRAYRELRERLELSA